ncbi:MAG: excinuclease ABC subunit UvrC [Polyangiaceae bacterium]|nr:excinuclease ABC subunit UvrC [Polyangiaceae bacterium]
MTSELPPKLNDKLSALTREPGCYLFRNRQGVVVYVGKASCLRSRVRSYFQPSSGDDRILFPMLVASVFDLETIVTASEKEAAILENGLIKEHKPRFNIKLRDDKEYLTLRVRTDVDFPRLEFVRRPTVDGARYFGPYHSASAARKTTHLVEKHFQLRTCTDREMKSRKRVCLQYQIKRCPGPCVHDIDRAEYAARVNSVMLFLDGRHDELTKDLNQKMTAASTELNFELAAIYRDQLTAVDSVRQTQRIVENSDKDQDIVGLYREGDLVELAVMSLKRGRIIDAVSISQPRVEIPDDEVIASFVREYYGEAGPACQRIPDEVLVPNLPEGAAGVMEWLSCARAERAGGKARRCQLLAPSRGARRRLLDMAMENAKHAFEEKRRVAEAVDERLARIQQKLRLPVVPRRIECIDISHSAGQDTVGAIVRLKDGVPDKSGYKSFNVKTVDDGDDYAAMFEVLSRRFQRARQAAEDDTSWELPDLLVVDGGRGQLGVALAAAGDLGLHGLSIAGLAKERETVTGDKLVDRVYLPGQKNPVSLKANSPELFLLAMARDEAHRFANRGRKKRGKARTLRSALDDVPGIGPKSCQSLLKTLGSVDGVRAASDSAILAVPGISKKQLAAIREHLKPSS